jgi:hypothetical protein
VRESKGWRHFPMSERISYLIEFLESEQVRQAYRRRMRTLLVFFIGLLVTLWAAAAATIPSQLTKGGIQRAAAQAQLLHEQGEHLRAAFAERRFLVLAAELRRDEFRLRAMRLHDELSVMPTSIRARIEGLEGLSGLYLALYGPAASRKALTEALQFTEFVHHLALLVAESNPVAGWRALAEAQEMAGKISRLLALLGDSLEQEGHPEGARLAFQDALSGLPPEHPDAAVIRERLAALDPGS